MKFFITHADLARPSCKQPQSYNKVGKVSAESVHRHTGKDWKQWIPLLEVAGARAWTYQELVAYLKKKYKLSPWWQHGVAMGFEIATGKRKEGQDVKGNYMVTATKSLAAAPKDVWSWIVSPEGQEVWLKPLSEIEVKPKNQFETSDGYFGEVRTLTKGRRVRLYWQDPVWEKHTVLEIMLVPRPGKKCLIVFNHTGLKDTKLKESLGKRWRSAAEQAQMHFED